MKLESLKSKKFESFIFDEIQDAHRIIGGTWQATTYGATCQGKDQRDYGTKDGPDKDMGTGEGIDIKWNQSVIPLGGNPFIDTCTGSIGGNGNIRTNYPTINVAVAGNKANSTLVTILSHFPEDNPNVAVNNTNAGLNSAVASLNNSVVNLNNTVASLNSSVGDLKRH